MRPDVAPVDAAPPAAGERRPRRLRRRVLLGLAVSLALLAAVGALALGRLAVAEDSRAWVDHTHQVLAALAALDARPARDAVDEVARLTRDNPVQQARVSELRRLAGARPTASPTSRGPAQSDSLAALVARMQATERDLLRARAAAESAATRRTRVEVAAAVSGGCALGLAVLGLLWTDAGRRLRAEADRDALILTLRDTHEELEAQNEQLVAQSEELVVQSEQLMRQSDAQQDARDYLAAVLGHMADGVVAFDERGTVTLCNPAAQLVLGLPHGAVPVADWGTYAQWYDAEGGACLADAATPVTRVRRGGTVRNAEVAVAPRGARAGDGPVRRIVSVAGRPVRDRAGRSRGSILVLHDVTDRKSAERLKSELVSVVSHELRTPLTSIRGSLGLLEGGAYGALPDAVRRLVTIGRSNTDRLIRLVNDLLDLEKLQAGRMELRDDAVDVVAIVGASAEGVRSFAAEQGVRVEAYAEAAAGAVVRGDADRLTQVLTNLLSNAIKFTPVGTTVTLAAERPSPGVARLTVRDAGPGIAEQDVPRLFRRFQQLDASDTRRHDGTGLGLAITKDLVEQHGGRIGVVSRPGEGALFWVELPCSPRVPLVGAAGSADFVRSHHQPAPAPGPLASA